MDGTSLPARTSRVRLKRGWRYAGMLAVGYAASIGTQLLWPGGGPVDWFRDFGTIFILVTAMGMGFVIVRRRFGLAALYESAHPSRWRANLLFLAVTISVGVGGSLLWNRIVE